MASDPKTVAFIVDQAPGAGAVSARPMFGEYGVFCDGKMVAIVGEDQLFVKATTGGSAYAAGAEERPPYPGAKPCLVIDPERWDDGEWLAELLRVTAAELPAPKPRKTRAGR